MNSNLPLSNDLFWIAQRHGQDWRDEDVLNAVEWLASLVPSDEWAKRSTGVEARFESAKGDWAEGRRSVLYDPADMIAWYVYQARCYADPSLRPDFFEPEGYRIAPVFRRLGQMLPLLKQIEGADERAARLMRDGKAQPDDGIYEFLVAAAYQSRGWSRVAFVPEMPGIRRQHDLFVERGRSNWAVECKRAGRSGYARDERLAGERMSAAVHEISRDARRPLMVMVRFEAELSDLSDRYLAEKAAAFLNGRKPFEWQDEGGAGVVADVVWEPLLHILRTDDVYFGSSRMIQLLLGGYDPSADYSVAGDWAPAEGRPLHATSISHVSLVTWRSASPEAARRKAQHFRGVVGRASDQLPGDRPGVVHVGYEAIGGNSVDGLRHRLNRREMRSFDAKESRLRWVYANYMMPEHVIAQNESAAIVETTAWYRVGTGGTREPLKWHMLFLDDDGQPGSHFTG
jgi:hypothetical protein